MRAAPLLASLLFLSTIATAQVSSDPFAEGASEEEELTPDKKRDWTFAQPGKTATRTAFNTAGKPSRDFEGRVIQGEMDPLVQPKVDGKDDPLLVQRAKNQGKGLSFVHVLEYDEPNGKVVLVFRDDVLWYIVQPTRAGETKQEEVTRRFGDSPKMSSGRRKVEGADHTARIHWFPESGVGFVQLDGAETYSHKIVYEAKAGSKPRN